MHRQIGDPLAPAPSRNLAAGIACSHKVFPMKRFQRRHTRLVSLRRSAAMRQGWCCCYCALPMWESAAQKAAVMDQFDLSESEADALRCTAEHLQARCDGGRDASTNIAAACARCNHGRHAGRASSAPNPASYLGLVAVQRR